MTAVADTRETRGSASEVKFIVDPAVAERVRERIRTLLNPDPYASGPLKDQYSTTTIYFDTADFAVYHRRGSYRRAKYRVRRYGQSDLVFLERKMRTKSILSKRRSSVPVTDLPLLTAHEVDRNWSGAWFHERLLKRRLRPVCEVSYQRTARVGMTDYGPIRLTIDDQLRGLAIDVPDFCSAERWADALPLTNLSIIEMKFRAAMPAVFKQVVEEFHLVSSRVSKYRFGLEATRSIRVIDETEALADGV